MTRMFCDRCGSEIKYPTERFLAYHYDGVPKDTCTVCFKLFKEMWNKWYFRE